MGKSYAFDPSKDIPSLKEKVILVTGGTAGLGKESILNFAKHDPARIFFTGRNKKSATAVIEAAQAVAPDVPVEFIEMDLASLPSVQVAAKNIASLTPRLDILLANAGIMAVPPGLTSDGYEIQFGTNHLGHALLIKLLLPTLQHTSQLPSTHVRIVSNTSQGFKLHPGNGIDFANLRTTQESPVFGHWTRYGQSKLANLLYAAELARRYPAITSTAVHPGVINTGLISDMAFADRAFIWATTFHKMVGIEEGAKNQLWAATGQGVENGAYYEPVGVPGSHDKLSTDVELAGKLWEWTEGELAKYA